MPTAAARGSALRASPLHQRLGPSGLAEAASVEGDRANPNITKPSTAPSAVTRPLFSMPLDFSGLAQSITVKFHCGGTKPGVVFRSGYRCCRRVFQDAFDHLRFAQSSEIQNQNHRCGILLSVCCRHAEFPTMSSSRTSTSPNFTWDPFRTQRTGHRPLHEDISEMMVDANFSVSLT